MTDIPFTTLEATKPTKIHTRSPEYGSEAKTASFAPSHPMDWGAESASIRLPGSASSVSINDGETLLAVGYCSRILIYDIPSHKLLHTVPQLGCVDKVLFQPMSTTNRLPIHSTMKHYDERGLYMHDENIDRLMVVDASLKSVEPLTLNDRFPLVVRRAASVAKEAIMHRLGKVGEMMKKLEGEGLLRDPEETLMTSFLEQELYNSPWYERTEQKAETLNGPSHGPSKTEFSPDGTFFIFRRDMISPTTLISASPPFAILHQLTLPGLVSLSTPYTPDARAVSPDGRFILTTTQESAYHGAHDDFIGRIQLWSTTDGTLVRTIGPFPGLPSQPPIISPNGKLIASHTHPNICIWRMGDGALVQTLPSPAHSSRYSQPTFAFSPTGEYLAVLNPGNTLKLFDVQSGKIKYLWWPPKNGPGREGIRRILFDKRSRLFWQTYTGTVFAYDIANKLKWQFNGRERRDATELGLVLTNDGFLSADSDGVVRFWTL